MTHLGEEIVLNFFHAHFNIFNRDVYKTNSFHYQHAHKSYQKRINKHSAESLLEFLARNRKTSVGGYQRLFLGMFRSSHDRITKHTGPVCIIGDGGPGYHETTPSLELTALKVHGEPLNGRARTNHRNSFQHLRPPQTAITYRFMVAGGFRGL